MLSKTWYLFIHLHFEERRVTLNGVELCGPSGFRLHYILPCHVIAYSSKERIIGNKCILPMHLLPC